MSRTFNPIHAFALAAGGIAVAFGGTALAQVDATSGCEVLANPGNGGFTLEAIYHAEVSTQGAYRFSVQSAGGGNRTSINQGGGFSARAGETLTLGRVNVGGASAYDVTLTIDAGGQPVECGGRISTNA
ncbi:curli-like amyloid fiber formation chaperone CsgH [Pelagibacterium sediminicola]|uniref:curli-like amyloid fiber formation chaperone CsgH n=1 Tax=Pelagibacterium sediminicola TaxID=2248761 RepID=UPI000E31946C|nr:curli-like amyloid fiber formation chaperone CsgH [Pelagibacterium sediminicola]